MCRWLAYSGSPLLLDELLYKPPHSLIDQSLHAHLGAQAINGDGFGVGWYDDNSAPALFKSVEPAWNDQNLRELSQHVRSRLIFAHVRASTGSPIQQANCHPFRFGKWLWMHNGQISNFPVVKRDLVLAVSPALFPRIEGSTDTEVFFFLALTFGLEEDPPAGVERAVGFIERVCREHAVANPVRLSVALSDGVSTWAFRYSSDGNAPSLYYSTSVEDLRSLYPDNQVFQALSNESRVVVSEPLGDRPGAWNEVAVSSYGIVHEGRDEIHPFVPRTP